MTSEDQPVYVAMCTLDGVEPPKSLICVSWDLDLAKDDCITDLQFLMSQGRYVSRVRCDGITWVEFEADTAWHGVPLNQGWQYVTYLIVKMTPVTEARHRKHSVHYY